MKIYILSSYCNSLCDPLVSTDYMELYNKMKYSFQATLNQSQSIQSIEEKHYTYLDAYNAVVVAGGIWKEWCIAEKDLVLPNKTTDVPNDKNSALVNTAKITSFYGRYAFLDNFYYAPILYLGKRYANNAAAFYAQKTVHPQEQRRFCLPYLTDPSKAYSLAQQISVRHDWAKVQFQCMYDICFAKFLQHNDLLEKLLLTGDSLLENGNTRGDQYWGKVNGIGYNHLGIILMDIREKLK